MSRIIPGTERFEAHVYGTVFGGRAEVLARLRPGDTLILVPDPPGTDEPSVWVHASGGDVIGHLSPDINRWLVPLMLGGRRCRAEVSAVAGPEVESWRRLVITVTCRH